VPKTDLNRFKLGYNKQNATINLSIIVHNNNSNSNNNNNNKQQQQQQQQRQCLSFEREFIMLRGLSA